MHAAGVLRTCSVPFTLDAASLADDFVHLSNHCVQTASAAYGQFEATNEMFYEGACNSRGWRESLVSL